MRAFLCGLVVALAGCSGAPPAQCDATLCSGCCTSTGQCVGGTAQDACGANGAACDVCVGGQTCSAGKCGGSSAGGGSGGGVGGGAGGGGGTGGGAQKMGGFPDIVNGSNGRHPQFVIDAAGVRHLLYEELNGPVRYGECASGCASSGNWTFTTIGDKGDLGGFAKLALTAQGKPRAVWNRTPTINDNDVLWAGSCDSNCTSAAGWTTGAVRPFANGEYLFTTLGRNLAVDGTGKMHLVYPVNGLHYTSCASNCAQPASWSAPVKLSNARGRASLVAGAAGQLKVAFTTSDDSQLFYRSCDGNCDNAANWVAAATIWPSIEGAVSLRVDPQGRPRIFFNENGAGGRSLTLYTWCEGNCGVAASWQTVTVGLEAQDGKMGLDFDLGSDGSVAAAYDANGKLGVLKCAANCQTLTMSAWAREVREDGDAVKAETSPPIPAVCATLNPPKQGYAYWYPGEQASVAVNPIGGKLEVVHRTYTLEKCGSAGNVSEGVTIPRYSGPF